MNFTNSSIQNKDFEHDKLYIISNVVAKIMDIGWYIKPGHYTWFKTYISYCVKILISLNFYMNKWIAK